MRRAVTRQEVLDVSAGIFARNGYRATNLKLVADRLNVTRQALYYHFGSKSEILGALFNAVMTKLEDAAAAAADVEGDGEVKLARMLRAHLQVIADNTDLVAILIHERAEIANVEGLNAPARRRAYTDSFAAAYEEGVAAGQLEPFDSLRAVRMLLAAANSMSWWIVGDDAGTEVVMADVYRMLISGFLVDVNRRKVAAPRSRRVASSPSTAAN